MAHQFKGLFLFLQDVTILKPLLLELLRGRKIKSCKLLTKDCSKNQIERQFRKRLSQFSEIIVYLFKSEVHMDQKFLFSGLNSCSLEPWRPREMRFYSYLFYVCSSVWL